MCRFVSYPLALLCGLILALPPGWCAAFCRAATPPEQAGHCSSCCPAERHEPTPAPCRQAPPLKCCCADIDRTTPPSPEKLPLDLSFAVPLTSLDLEGRSAAGALLEQTGPRAAAPPLHLLHCVWLC